MIKTIVWCAWLISLSMLGTIVFYTEQPLTLKLLEFVIIGIVLVVVSRVLDKTKFFE